MSVCTGMGRWTDRGAPATPGAVCVVRSPRKKPGCLRRGRCCCLPCTWPVLAGDSPACARPGTLRGTSQLQLGCGFRSSSWRAPACLQLQPTDDSGSFQLHLVCSFRSRSWTALDSFSSCLWTAPAGSGSSSFAASPSLFLAQLIFQPCLRLPSSACPDCTATGPAPGRLQCSFGPSSSEVLSQDQLVCSSSPWMALALLQLQVQLLDGSSSVLAPAHLWFPSQAQLVCSSSPWMTLDHFSSSWLWFQLVCSFRSSSSPLQCSWSPAPFGASASLQLIPSSGVSVPPAPAQ
ncbi:uncharacterized protein LOC129206275 isoform X2 [Grus americana]|uniref:uncharacterized protein LOC129206275 isoform X2 n=1 Tax=Grus americana TaxID=9117 RepID=UPI0024079E88|nr:uncharacterized protein LOC129206275 isoform X2 [Grus americana]